MTEKRLAIPVGDLRRVRVLCQSAPCGGAMELPLDRLDRAFGTLHCPFCGATHRKSPQSADDLLAQLARAVRGLQEIQDKLGVEFLLPLTD